MLELQAIKLPLDELQSGMLPREPAALPDYDSSSTGGEIGEF